MVEGLSLGKLHRHEIMQCPDTVEFELGQRVAGHRGYFLKGVGVLLNQALIFNRKRNLFRIEKEVKES